MKSRRATFLLSTLSLASFSAFAQTFSGTALSGLDYEGAPGDSQYVAGTPDIAQLITPDAGLGPLSDSPAVYVDGPLGNLGNITATYDLLSSSVPAGTSPYWILWVSPPGDNNPNDQVAVIQFSQGTTLSDSSTIHVLDPNGVLGTYFGDTLATLDSTSLGAYTFGDMTVDFAGVEIGNWAVSDSTSAFADIESLTISSVPDGASTLFLSVFGFVALAILGRRIKCPQDN